MPSPRPLAAHWRRFRRLMAFMAVLAVAVAGGALWWLWATGVPMPVHFVIAFSLAVVVSLLLAGGLMGLVFVSNRSGHDDEIGEAPPSRHRHTGS